VEHDPDELDEEGMHPLAFTEVHRSGKVIDILKTAARQTYWNGWAALAAAAAALAQAVATALEAVASLT
jgi:hypothetical protein